MTISSFTGKNRFLSNFWPCKVRFGGEEYPSVEHAYQAAKTNDKFIRKVIQETSTPGKAKRLGRKLKVVEDFDEIKTAVMILLLFEKFEDPELREKLSATGNEELIEGNTWGDTYWGVCNGIWQKPSWQTFDESAK